MSDPIQRWEAILAAQPANDLARFSLGKALFDAGRFDEAIGQFEQALARKPDWMVVQILLGKAHQARGNTAAARGAFERALKLAVDQHHEGPQMELEQLLEDLGT